MKRSSMALEDIDDIEIIESSDLNLTSKYQSNISKKIQQTLPFKSLSTSTKYSLKLLPLE